MSGAEISEIRHARASGKQQQAKYDFSASAMRIYLLIKRRSGGAAAAGM